MAATPMPPWKRVAASAAKPTAGSWLSVYSGSVSAAFDDLEEGQREVAGDAEDLSRASAPERLEQCLSQLHRLSSRCSDMTGSGYPSEAGTERTSRGMWYRCPSER